MVRVEGEPQYRPPYIVSQKEPELAMNRVLVRVVERVNHLAPGKRGNPRAGNVVT